MSSKYTDLQIFSVLHQIPLDVEGSNIAEQGWCPSEQDLEYMPQDSFDNAKKEYEDANRNVIFKNTSLLGDYDADDYFRSYLGGVSADGQTVEYADGDLYFKGGMVLPVPKATVWDFYRACQLSGIELELSDYGIKLLDGSGNEQK